MPDHNDESDGHSSRKREHSRSRRPSQDFRKTRRSFVPDELLKRIERQEQNAHKLSLRKFSRAFSQEVDPRDIANPHSRIILEWKDVKFEVAPSRSFADVIKGSKPESEMVLKGISGVVHPGEVLAVLGPSGSGKSLLINLLAGRVTNGTITGQILLNGFPRSKDWPDALCFVEQDSSYLEPLMTVRELLDYTATLTIPSKYSKTEREARIQHAMKVMDIAHIADSKIGGPQVKGISGGERKRLCIALELLQEPKVLFIDEPTSGLDAKSAADLIKYLYQLAIVDDLSIIITIHQPRMSIVSKFHNILILAGGRQIVFGTVDEALDFYEDNGYPCSDDENPADHFLQTLKPLGGDVSRELAIVEFLNGQWKVKEPQVLPFPSVKVELMDLEPDWKPTETGPKHNLPLFKEVQVIIKRYFKVVTRDKEYFAALNFLIIVPTILAIAVFFQIPDTGFGAVQNRIGLLAYLPYDGTAITVMIALVFTYEYAIRRERYRSMARSWSYYIALMLVQFPLWILSMMFAYLLYYYICGLRYTPFTAMLIYMGFQLLVAIHGISVGIIFSALTSNIQLALTIGTFYSIMIRLFNGLAVNTNGITWVLRWIRYISPLFYYNTGVNQNEFVGQTLDGEPGEYWLTLFALDLVSVMWCAGALMIMTAASIVAGMFLFRRKTSPPTFQI